MRPPPSTCASTHDRPNASNRSAVGQLGQVRAQPLVKGVVARLLQPRRRARARDHHGQLLGLRAGDLDVRAVSVRERHVLRALGGVRERLEPPVEDGQIGLARA
jgi:hypothetical protein